MDRMRPLEPPHLGIRNALGQVSFALGNTDVGESHDRAALAQLFSELMILLHDHARQEDHYIFRPAETAAPGSSATAAAMHLELERDLQDLGVAIASFDGSQSAEAVAEVVRSFHRFHLRYLDHMLDEELTIEPILLAHQTDEEMIADQVEIMQTVDFATLLLWFKYIVPARRDVDNRQVLAAFKSFAPKEAFSAVSGVLRDVLPRTRYEALTSDL